MTAIMENIQANMVAYGVFLVCVTPILYVFRRWTGPLILHSIEGVLYYCIFHVVFYCMVRFFGYFRDASKMQAIEAAGDLDVPLGMPFLEPWNQEMYSPAWLFYVECAAVLGVLYVVIFMRPFNVGTSNSYQGKSGKMGAAPKKQDGYQYRRNRKPEGKGRKGAVRHR